jgi:hypothetical protein
MPDLFPHIKPISRDPEKDIIAGAMQRKSYSKRGKSLWNWNYINAIRLKKNASMPIATIQNRMKKAYAKPASEHPAINSLISIFRKSIKPNNGFLTRVAN